ncbi:MAG: DUF4142 domain-containing protein [Flavipsychrobacter sp.]
MNMYLLKRSFFCVAIASVLLASCANDKKAEGDNQEEHQNIDMGEVMAPPVLPQPEEGVEGGAQVNMLSPGQSFDEKGNVVDMDGNIVMPAEEAKKNNIQEQPHEKATDDEIKIVQDIFDINNKYIATAKLAGEKATRSDIMDVAVQLEGEHTMLNDITRNFLDITHAKVEEKKNVKAEVVTGAKGEAWDKAWANKMLDINKEFISYFRRNENVVKHHELKNIILQYSEHISNEQQMLKDVIDQ